MRDNLTDLEFGPTGKLWTRNYCEAHWESLNLG